MTKRTKMLLSRAITLPLAAAMVIGNVPFTARAASVGAKAGGTASKTDDVVTVTSEAKGADAGELDGWEFAYFGTSTSKTANTKVQGIAAGTDLSQAGNGAKVSLTSCTYGADDAIGSKGGKFVATDGYDGISYYYTTLDATKDNFYLEATVTVDYINPSPDGQEGFALLARDSIGENGVASSAFYTNSVAAIGTKLSYTDSDGQAHTDVKDTVGYRIFEGIDDTVNAPVAGLFNLYAGGLDQATNEADAKIKKGGTYRISLEETDYAYIVTYYKEGLKDSSVENGEAGKNSYIYYKVNKDADPLRTIDKDKQYVGFAVARGCNATFSNIIFRTTAADTSQWHEPPTTLIPTDYQITSPKTSYGKYTLVFKANADGTATIKQDTKTLKTGWEIKANTSMSYDVEDTLTTGNTTFTVEFTPKADYSPGAYQKLEDYSTKTITHQVSVRSFSTGSPVYVSNSGTSAGTGAEGSPVDIATAFQYAQPGQTIILKAETYTLNDGLLIERGINGTSAAPITVKSDSDTTHATLDFNQKGTGLEIWGDYWNFKNIDSTRSTGKGCQLAGHHVTLESMNFYNNGNTGLQVSGTNTETKEMWPSYNLIKNCSSMNNADKAMEDADGFAAKLTTGDGNVFDGCIAAYNADDGWDLFAKTATGPIGNVTIKNCVAYRNGFLIVGTSDTLNTDIIKSVGSTLPSSSVKFDGKNFGTATVNGNNITFTGTAINSGNGNGFKMGGSGMSGAHVLRNSVSFENKAKGIDSNSGSDIKVYDSVSYNNGGANVALYSNSKIVTNFAADGLISFRTPINDDIMNIGENISLYGQKDTITFSSNNYFWDKATKTSKNGTGEQVSADWFEVTEITNDILPTRNADGSINMHGVLVLTDKAAEDAGNRPGNADQEDTTLWVVGDSTVSAFSDKYYLPRYGWGTQLTNVLKNSVTVKNLAVSGTSSKSFTKNDNYQTLLDGMKAGDYLMIGFGHNDQKAGDETFTKGTGDYKTAGSFANSLYENYIKKAQEKNVGVILVTPIARRSSVNDYSGANGHVTEDGDYAQAIRNLGKALNIPVCDMTKKTIERNMDLDTDAVEENDSKYLQAWPSRKEQSVDNTHTNMFGAAVNAYDIAMLLKDTDSGLKNYLKSKPENPLANVTRWREKSLNEDYEEPEYTAPTTTSTTWPAYKDANGNTWYGSVFGDAGGASNTTDTSKFGLGPDKNNKLNIKAGISGNTGKIAASSDGLAMYYIRIPVDSSFSLKADATINGFNKTGSWTNQAAFGLMVRDDMYVDYNTGSVTMGDYVAAGVVQQSSGVYKTFARKAGVLDYEGGKLDAGPAAGEKVSLEIASTGDGYAAAYNGDKVISGYDFSLNMIDGDYVYVGMFAVRAMDVTFDNIELTINGKVVKDFDSMTDAVPGDGEDDPGNDKDDNTKKKVKAKSVSITLNGVKISGSKVLPVQKGKTYSLKAAIKPTNTTNKTIKWKSSNKKVATVSSKGKVKILKANKTVTITATTSNGKKASVKFKTQKKVVKVSKVKISGNKTMKVKKKQTLKLTVTPATAKNTNVTWKSSNKKVATVSKKGVVTAKKKGTVTITATAKDGSKRKAKITIKVKK